MTFYRQSLQNARRGKKSLKTRALIFFKRNWAGWLIMLPSLVLFSFFIWIPMVRNVGLAFSETRGYEAVGFNGFANFKAVFEDPMFKSAFTNTFIYAGFSVLIGFLIPIILGLLLSEAAHFKGLFRVGLYFPAIISGMAVAMMWKYMLDPTATGFFNVLLMGLGVKTPFNFLSNPKAVIPLIVLTMTWRGAGSTALIYLSALQTADNQQYEAARIDGAGALKRVWHVTLPHLAPMIRMLFVLQIISVFQVFYEPLVMTDGGPAGGSMSLLLLSYKYAFDGIPEVGKSAATGVLTAAVITVFTIIYLYFSRPQKQKMRGLKNA